MASDQPLPASVTAAILYRNLIGQRFLSLEQGAGPTGQVLPAGGTIPVERTRPPLNLTVLFNGFKPLFTALDPQQVNQLSFEIVQVLQGQGGTVQSLLASTSSLTNTLADRDAADRAGHRQPERGARHRQRPRRAAVGPDLLAAGAGVRPGRGPQADRRRDRLHRRADRGHGRLRRGRAARRCATTSPPRRPRRQPQRVRRQAGADAAEPARQARHGLARAAATAAGSTSTCAGCPARSGWSPTCPPTAARPPTGSPSPRCGPDPDGVQGQAPDPLGGPALPAPPAAPQDLPLLGGLLGGGG